MDQAQELRNVIKWRESNEPKARVITITSGKGGVGKSNVAVNFAAQLTILGKRVIIFDADIGLANVEVLLGTTPKYHLGDLIFSNKTIKEIITTGPLGIGFISGGTGISGLNNLSKAQIVNLVHNMSQLNQLADVIIVDTGAGISNSVLEFVLSSPEIMLVITPEPSSLTDSYSLLKALYRNPSFFPSNVKVHVVANKVTSTEDGIVAFQKMETVVKKFLGGEISYLGMIPQDKELEKCVRQQKIVSIDKTESISSKAFELLAKNFVFHEEKRYDIHKGITQIFVNLISKKKS